MKRATPILCSVLLAACSAKAPPPDDFWPSLEDHGASWTRAAAIGRNAHPADSARGRADGGRYFSEIALQQLQRQVFADPDFPVFRTQYPESAHTGLVNPDNLYESTPIRPGVEYLIRGTRGTTADLVFQVYEANPGVEGSLRGISTLSASDLKIESDGSFEIHVGPREREGNWLATDEKAGLLLVRWSHSDWANERAGRAEVIRIGAEGEPSPNHDASRVARSIRKAGEAIPDAGSFWLDFVGRIRFFLGENTVGATRQTGDQGLEGQVSAMGRFVLEEDEALVLSVPKTSARYQGVQLGNEWFDALEWANRQTSLSAGQAHRASDGRYYYVISAQDPGVPNWLDTTGLRRGLFFLRFQGLSQAIPKEDLPKAELVNVKDLRRLLPADTPVVDAAMRQGQLAARQQQLRRRYGR